MYQHVWSIMGTGRLSDKSWSRIWELQWGFDLLNVRYHVFSLDEVWRLFFCWCWRACYWINICFYCWYFLRLIIFDSKQLPPIQIPTLRYHPRNPNITFFKAFWLKRLDLDEKLHVNSFFKSIIFEMSCCVRKVGIGCGVAVCDPRSRNAFKK